MLSAAARARAAVRQITTRLPRPFLARPASTAAVGAAGAAAAAGPSPAQQRAVGAWLFGCAGAVVTTVVVGGVTRLTGECALAAGGLLRVPLRCWGLMLGPGCALDVHGVQRRDAG